MHQHLQPTTLSEELPWTWFTKQLPETHRGDLLQTLELSCLVANCNPDSGKWTSLLLEGELKHQGMGTKSLTRVRRIALTKSLQV